MISFDFQKLVTMVKEKMEQPLPEKSSEAFKTQVGKTRRLVYFGDNAGEIVLDKLLISTLKKLFDLEIVFVVRSMPTLNDVTLLEARDIKMDKMVPVVNSLMKPKIFIFECRASEESGFPLSP